MTDNQITVEVAYALPGQQSLQTIAVDIGSTVRDAIEHSGVLQQFPEIDLEQQKVGIWSRTVKLDEQLKQGDRVEIYRALIADPKDLRRRRAEKAKEEGRADKVTGGRVQERPTAE